MKDFIDTYKLIIDLSGKIISSDNLDLLQIIQQEKIRNILDIVLDEQKKYVISIISQIKANKIENWKPDKSILVKNFRYCVKRFIPLYSAKSEVNRVAVYLSKIETNRKGIEIDETIFDSLFNHINDAIFVTNMNGNFLEINNTAIKRTGFDRQKFLKLNIKNTPVKSSAQNFVKYFRELLRYGESSALIDYIHSDGNLVETEISGKTIMYSGMKALLHISRDISIRNRNYIKGLESIIQAEEKEKSSVAYEIKEVLGPNLSLLKMYIESYIEQKDNKFRESLIQKIKQLIDSSLQELTEISDRLSPHVLKGLGLKSAIEVFIMKMETRSKINYNYKLNIPDTVSKESDITIYRVVAEIIDNINKHSFAKRVNIKADTENNYIIFEITDDGIGFNIDEAFVKKEKSGILNISNRIKSIKGSIDFKSIINQGTTVKIEIPLDETK